MNLGDMKTQFSALLKRRDNTPALTDIFFTQAITRVQRDLRCPAMEKIVTLATNATTYSGGLVIPSDFLGLISLRVYDTNGNFVRVIEGRDEDTVARAARTNDIPYFYCRDGSKWVLGPSPIEGLTVRIKYYSDLGLEVDADQHTLTNVASDLFIYGALSYAADYFLDKRVERFEQRFQNILVDLQDQADLDELDGSHAVSPAYSLDFSDCEH
jgi:hypothetical protein